MYPLSDRKIYFKNSLCLVCATDYPVFEVKAKINVLVHSDVINRSKPFVLTIEYFRLLVLSKARTRCDDMTQDQPSNNLISLFNMQNNYMEGSGSATIK